MGYTKAWSTLRGIWYGLQLDDNDNLKVNPGALTQQDIVSSVNRDDLRANNSISYAAGANTTITLAADPAKSHVVVGLGFTNPTTAGTLTLTVGGIIKWRLVNYVGHLPVLIFPMPIAGGLNTAVVLTLAGGDANTGLTLFSYDV